MIRFLLFTLLCGCCILSCKKSEEQIDTPPDPNGNGGTDTTITDTTIVDTTLIDTSIATNPQLVLLETFNGFRCSNCPQADDLAQNLSEIYGEQLIIVGIHASPQFAAPTGTPPDEPYSTDFRTEAGTAYWQAFGSPGLPRGMFNRREIDGTTVILPSAWGERADEIIQETAKAAIQIENLTYNSDSRQVAFDVSMATAEGLDPGSYFITLYLTEDSIVDWQLDIGVDVPDYLHRHVLRDNINGTWGDLAFDSADPGQENTLSYQYTLDDAWVQERCEIIAYIYHGDTREIVQVDKHYVMGE